MHKWFIILSIFFISCKSNEQKAQAQSHYIGPLRQLTENEIRVYNDSISHYMDSTLNDVGFSGGMLVAKNGIVLYEHYQGFSDAAHRNPINDTTPFHVASTSKTFTSHAILQMMQQGKLKLTDPIQNFFPGFPYEGVTVETLLDHTSGLQNYANFMPALGWNKKQIATNDDMLDFIITKKPPLAFPVGKKFNYCNTNFALLALIVEKLTNKPFPQYVKENIFEPAGMSHSFIMGINDTAKYLPSFKGRSIYNFDFLDAIYGDKNVYTTCQDLMKYDAAIRDHILLDSSSYELAWEPLQNDYHYGDTIEHYGLGWRLKVWPNGNKIVYHNGWWHGNNSVFQRLFQDTAVIIITGNLYNTHIYHMKSVINFFKPYYGEAIPTDEPSETDPIGANTPALEEAVEKKITSPAKKTVKTAPKKTISKKEAKKIVPKKKRK